MMYRREVHRTLNFGTVGKFLELQEKKNALLAEAGCTPYRVWCPAFGELHHLTLEACFASMTAYEEEGFIISGIAGIPAIDAEQIQLVRPGTAEDRLSKVLVEPTVEDK